MKYSSTSRVSNRYTPSMSTDARRNVSPLVSIRSSSGSSLVASSVSDGVRKILTGVSASVSTSSNGIKYTVPPGTTRSLGSETTPTSPIGSSSISGSAGSPGGPASPCGPWGPVAPLGPSQACSTKAQDKQRNGIQRRQGARMVTSPYRTRTSVPSQPVIALSRGLPRRPQSSPARDRSCSSQRLAGREHHR